MAYSLGFANQSAKSRPVGPIGTRPPFTAETGDSGNSPDKGNTAWDILKNVPTSDLTYFLKYYLGGNFPRFGGIPGLGSVLGVPGTGGYGPSGPGTTPSGIAGGGAVVF